MSWPQKENPSTCPLTRACVHIMGSCVRERNEEEDEEEEEKILVGAEGGGGSVGWGGGWVAQSPCVV